LPVIGVHHAFGDYRRRSRKVLANLFRSRLSLLGVSDAVRDDIRACLPRWPADRIQTLYNRIDVDQLSATLLSREEARDALGLPRDAWVVGNVGRLHPDKDQSTLLRGFAQALPDLPADSRVGNRPRGHAGRPGNSGQPLLQGLRRVRPEFRP
jgi:glycosyltransferase involved in cell wall biosynthesis